MKLQVAGASIEIEPDESGCWRTPFSLSAWEEFRCENSRPDAIGENLFLVLHPLDDRSPEAVGQEHYARGLEWVIANSVSIREAALKAIQAYVRNVLIESYGLDDPDLERIKNGASLIGEVDPSFLHLFPQRKNGLPYHALEFECSWDPEHGCGVMFCGADVVDVGISDTAQGGFDIDGHMQND